MEFLRGELGGVPTLNRELSICWCQMSLRRKGFLINQRILNMCPVLQHNNLEKDKSL